MMGDKKEMIAALQGLNDAFYRLLSVWNEDSNDTLNSLESVSIYPFRRSFDEVFNDVNDWTSATIEELGRKK